MRTTLTKTLKLLDNNFKTIFYAINILFMIIYITPTFLSELKNPLTYNNTKTINLEALEYVQLSNEAVLTQKIEPKLNHFGTIYLYFKPVNYVDCNKWLQWKTKLEQNISDLEEELDPTSEEFKHLKNGSWENVELEDLLTLRDEPAPIICEQNNRFNLNITIIDKHTKEYILNSTYEIYHDKPAATNYPFGFPVQKNSSQKQYIIEIKPIINEHNRISFIGIGTKHNTLVVTPSYHLPINQARTNLGDAFKIFLSKLSWLLQKHSLLTIIFIINIYFAYSTQKKSVVLLPNLLIFNSSALIIIRLISMHNLGGVSDLIIENTITYTLLLVIFTGFCLLTEYFININTRTHCSYKRKENEDDEEKKRRKNFSRKFHFISKIPLIKILVKQLYVEGWIYSFLLTGVVALGFILRYWNFNTLSYNADEGIYYILFKNMDNGSILPSLDSGALYLRSFFYTYISYFLNYFIKNPLISTRLVSLVFGLTLIVLGYNISKFLFNKPVALLTAFFISTSNFLIIYSIQGRHYMTAFFFYLLLFYLLVKDGVQSKTSKALMLASTSIVALNYEFVFLIMPLLIAVYLKNKNKYLLVISAIILLGFFIQYSYLSKLFFAYTRPHLILSVPVVNLDFFKPNFYVSGFRRLDFLILQFFLTVTIILLLDRKQLLNYYPSVDKHKYLFLQFISETFFLSFILTRNQIRYRGTLIILTFIVLSYFICLFLESSNRKQKLKTGSITLVLLVYFFVPHDLNYPATINYATRNSEAYLTTLSKIFSDPYGFASISSYTTYSNYKYINDLKTDNFLLTTDLYNVAPYRKPDFILNEYMQPFASYSEDNLSIYNNVKFINIEEIDTLIAQGNKILFFADNRIDIHLSESAKEYLMENFELTKEFNYSTFGIMDNVNHNKIRVYKSL